MSFISSSGALVAFAIIASGTVTVQAQETLSGCDGLSATRARTLAEEARRSGHHRRAAECYRLAGEPLEADRALSKAFVEANVATAKKASVTLESAKEQARRVREALRGPLSLRGT